MSMSDLLKAVENAEKSSETEVLKQDRRTCVMRANLLGKDVVIKRYELQKVSEKLKYLFRMSPARRFWATSMTMRDLNLATPEPYGFIEVYHGRIPVRSYMINAFVSDAVMSRAWIEKEYLELEGADRHAFADQLLDSLLQLYAHGIYHKDTKCENMLLRNADGPERSLLWIDLECALCRKPSRHDIIRNLVQINGSLGLNVRREDRLRFLEQMFDRGYVWANQPATIRKIADWTAKRLEKEKWET